MFYVETKKDEFNAAISLRRKVELKEFERDLWESERGSMTKVSDLATPHIEHCIRAIRQKKKVFAVEGLDQKWIERLTKELRSRLNL